MSTEEYLKGIVNNDPVILSKAITLFESSRPEDEYLTEDILSSIFSSERTSLRIGISGVPGAGKSTFIEGLGNYLTTLKKKVAVLTVDPSSTISKGSILGDKTRMETLAMNPLALIRTSPSSNYLGGVTMHTRKLIQLCEAAGYELILIETVGTGQSEAEVKQMTDLLLLLVLTGAGDELQGLKKGILELADVVLVNKAEGANLQPARQLQKELEHMLHLSDNSRHVSQRVELFSCIEGNQYPTIWKLVNGIFDEEIASGAFQAKRKKQNLGWMNEQIRNSLLRDFYQDAKIKAALNHIEELVLEGKLSPVKAAEHLVKTFKEHT